MFEINDGLSRMYGNLQVRFLGGKGTVKFPTYSTINYANNLRRENMNRLERLVKSFLLVLVSLLMMFFPSYYKLGGGFNPILEVFGSLPHFIDKILYYIIQMISLFGLLLFFYSIIVFLIEAFKIRD
jgi:hypothetical protein